ncbi:MAG TPA: 3-oxoacyl-ACP synthase III [Nitrospinota bacterium]|nr:3-oxoacyl-ACP synthase III [Nitrospinota bacterium]|tara:strand:+ start:41490 stop:42536 length:1047 start_codon:yes stop_codon:yes gene_type:complete
MRYTNVVLAGIGYEMAPNVVKSADLEDRLKPVYKRLKLPEGRLEMMTGIRERRFWNREGCPSQFAIKAGEAAIAKSGLSRSRIGAIFHASVSRDFLEPATANIVHKGLGLIDSALTFDISNACLGVLNGMVTIANMIELEQIEMGIVVAGEMGESLVNTTIDHLLKDKTLTRQSVKSAIASLTIGSGAVAILLCHKNIASDAPALVGGVAGCDTDSVHLCQSNMDQGLHGDSVTFMKTDSEQLLYAGCALAEKTWYRFLKVIGWSIDDITRSFTHQVGVAHRKLLYESIGLNISLDYSTVEKLGNIGSVSLPITMAKGLEENPAKKGEKAALLGIGSGLNCLMLGLQW